jgi:AmiR/NasT family two-component response regulator
MLVGIQEVLAEDGVEVLGPEDSPRRIVSEARRLQPDVVLLELDHAEKDALGAQIQRVAPHTKVIRLPRDETVIEVLDPASKSARVVPVTARGGLRNELATSRQHERVEE